MKQELLKKYLIGSVIVVLIIFGFAHMFIIPTNEVGFLGMDKVGRQVFIQTLNSYFDPNIKVDSEFNDTPLPIRIIAEPLRTTLKFDIRDDKEFQATEETVVYFLKQPASKIINQYNGKITMQAQYEPEVEQVKKTIKEKNVKTISDLLSGFGFKRFEIYSRGKLIAAIDLPRTANVAHVGGD